MVGTLLRVLVALSIAVCVACPASAQDTVRVRGTVERIEGPVYIVKTRDGSEVKLVTTEDKPLFVAIVPATMKDIKQGMYVGSAGTMQEDGAQKAIEVHIFPESMRGTGEGFRPWDGAPNSTMTNGTVGNTVTSVDGPVVTVKYKDGDKKIVVAPDVPIVRYEVVDLSALKPGAAFAVLAAVKTPDGSYDIKRINVGRDGVVPR